MNAVIKSTSISADPTGTRSSLENAMLAAEQCVKNAGINKNDIGLIIHTGTYRESNLSEPAIASLIQKKLTLNNDPITGNMDKRTFSFDLMKGDCGFLHASQIADSFLKNGVIKLVMILSGDVHPSMMKKPDFPYASIGSAVIIEMSEKNGNGFGNFLFKSTLNVDNGLLGFADIYKCTRSDIKITTGDDYESRLSEFALKAVNEYIQSKQVDLSGIKLLITSQPSIRFADNISKSIGLNGDSVINLFNEYGNPHTSVLPLGFHMAMERKLVKEGDKILFIGATAGLSAACALYEV